jgi:hypothetical protein
MNLEAMSLAVPDVAGHPNRLPFRGVLTLVGVASQRSPSGARGHLVMLTRPATEAALPSLLGMALDYAPCLDSHDVRYKVGIITEASIVSLHNLDSSLLSPGNSKLETGNSKLPTTDNRLLATGYRSPGRLAVSGHLFAQDFPEIVNQIRAQPHDALGMSYEITRAEVPNPGSAIWTVTAFTFTGAAILRRDKAAYPQTWIALATSN